RHEFRHAEGAQSLYLGARRTARRVLGASGAAAPPAWAAAARRRLGQTHLLQHRAAERAKRIAERLGQLEVVVALGGDQFNRLACLLQGGGEVVRLSLEFRRLE